MSFYSDTVIADTPVAYWRLNDTGATAVDQMSSNLHPGTLAGTITQSVAGGLGSDSDTAMTFDGSTGYISVADSADLSPEIGTSGFLTLECWAKPNGSGVAICKAGGGGKYEYALTITTAGITIATYTSGGGGLISLNAAGMSLGGAWHHFVGTISIAGTCYVYVDGVQKGSTAGVSGSTDTVSVVNIGRRADNQQYFNGGIDEVAIYGTQLSATQVLNHYQAGIAHAPSLLRTRQGVPRAAYY